MADIKEKLREIGHSGFDKEPHPEFTFDKSLLSSRDPLTQAEIDYVNMQVGDAVRKLAVEYGCEPQDADKIEARYWYSKKGHGFFGNDHVWGIFYDRDQSNFDEKQLDEPVPYAIKDFMREFERAMGEVNFNKGNTTPLAEGGRRAVGFSQHGWHGNYAFMRGDSRDVLLPMVRLIQQFDPEFTIRFDVPEQYTSCYDGISEKDLSGMANAHASVFWIDREWAQGELDRRAQGERWRIMQERIDHSRVEAQVLGKPQPLLTRLKIALSSKHVNTVDPEMPYGGAEPLNPTACGTLRGR
ncbi:MAG: hypothetical protein ACKVOE_01370 [Rickettsiales bacterium]